MDLIQTTSNGLRAIHLNSAVIITVVSFVLYYRKNIRIIIKTLPRDLKFLSRAICIFVNVVKMMLNRDTLITLFENIVKKNPDKIIYYFQDTSWTAKELNLYSNKIARIFQKRGYKKGDVVAFLCYNRPEYVGIWLGLGKIGVITALINTNLKSQSLSHCVNVAKCKGFIFLSDFIKEVNDIRESLSPEIEYIVYGSGEFENAAFKLDELLQITEGDVLGPDSPVIKPRDKMLYIYTSGTTGLPKAAIMSHQKLIFIGIGLLKMFSLKSDDIIYNSLPMYHTSGGLLSILPSLIGGISVVIRVKFSASNYFPDCIKYKCTIGQYIGEMCRYILAVPTSKDNSNHCVRMFMGNGVKPDVWKLFNERFKIPVLYELYGSTEGNSNIVNFDNTPGAVGFKPSLIPASLFPISIIKYDEKTDTPIRNKEGFCIRCRPNESGMCIGSIKNDPIRRFDGYVDKNDTNKKIIYNVFKKGDLAFLSGDILYMDELGYFYFKDRTGDTFRWKGENVSTIEIEMVVQKLINFKDCTVYGVQVGNLEGRAGMIAIADTNNEVDLDILAKGLDKNLPSFARPLFVRILPEIKITGTYKIVKTELKKEGFNVNIVNDKLYFKDPVKGFIPITKGLYNDIINGVIKV